MVAMFVGAIVLALLLVSGLVSRGDLANSRIVPWWAWAGGFLVAYSVSVEVANAMQQSMGPIAAAIVAAQLISAMVIDHFGWVGMPVDPINKSKLFGATLLIVGAALMQSKSH